MTLSAPTYNIVLAPLRGLTDAVFRNVYSVYFCGIDRAVTPFLTTVRGHKIKPSHIREVLPENNGKMKIVPQIIGNSAQAFISLASALFDIGHTIVNWNLGCPFPMVAKKKRGSGMLPYPEMVDDFLKHTLKAIPNRLSIKLRLGRFDHGEIFKLLPIFNRYPIEELIIHPRIGIQMYSGRPDLDCFAECLEKTLHPVVYNGDIVTLADFVRLRDRFTTVNSWMIGRGVLMDPFLPDRIKNGRSYSREDRIALFNQFHNCLFQEYARLIKGKHLVNKMKGFWTYFAHFLGAKRDDLKQIHKCDTVESYKRMVQSILAFCEFGSGIYPVF
jgi:tRNA-dihydrouridine synthase